MAYLGTPNSAARCTFDIGEPEFAELSGRVWSHLSVSYDGSVSKMWIDGVLKMQDSTTSWNTGEPVERRRSLFLGFS